MKKGLLFCLVLLLLLPLAYARQGHVKLLAVTNTATGYVGDVADLYLEIKPGTGRVFMDTFPLSKLDTQMSTRFAKEIACDYLDVDCEKYDFIYTIRANSAIVGGPSAGAAITVLTIALLDNLPLKDVSMTGTINSGGLIGPVGGIKAKVEAASINNIKTVLIPQGERFIKEINITELLFTNITLNESLNKTITIDLYEYAQERNVNLKEVATLTEALYLATGKIYPEPTGDIKIKESYTKTMKDIAVDLCNRANLLQEELTVTNESIKEEAVNLTNKGEDAFDNEQYYSAASYCYGANVKFRYLLLQDYTVDELKEIANQTYEDIALFDEEIEAKPQKTITDLQTYIIVKERLINADDYLANIRIGFNDSDSLYNLAYGIERLNSAVSWSKFFGQKGKEFNFKQETLRKSCMDKIYEAQERYQYVNLFFPTFLGSTLETIDRAQQDLENGDYELCLFKATKAKAESNVVLSVMGVEEDEITNLIELKLDVIKKTILREQDRGTFPILGYSYYEYANSLKEDDKYSALLYSEYALELSNLNMYFKEKDKIRVFNINYKMIYVFLIGLFTGILISSILKIKLKRRKHK